MIKQVLPKKTVAKKITSKKKKPVWGGEEKARCMADILLDKGAEEVVLLQVAELSSFTDYYLLCSANSEPQIRAIVDAVEADLSKKGSRPLGSEGMNAAQWVLMDYDDVILHIFRTEARSFYSLDRLWADAPRIDFPEKGRKKKSVGGV
jgi:ribosome-associated protein